MEGDCQRWQEFFKFTCWHSAIRVKIVKIAVEGNQADFGMLLFLPFQKNPSKKMFLAGNRKNMSNVAKVKFLFASNIWEQLIFIPF